MDRSPQLYHTYSDLRSPFRCSVTLKNKELWETFHAQNMEMIITKSGRRMFPALQIQVTDLDPHAHYCMLVELSAASHCRYKYSTSGGWAPTGAEEAQSPQRVYLHPESPATGEYWMSQPVSFDKLKVTNTPASPDGHLVLSSMHKYQPRFIIAKTSDPRSVAWAPTVSVAFPETQFIAVTAYQNEKITKLKIDNNPFAKGFRENGKSKCKRRRVEEEDREESTRQEVRIDPPPILEEGRVSVSSYNSASSSSEAGNLPNNVISHYENGATPPTPFMYPYWLQYPLYTGAAWLVHPYYNYPAPPQQFVKAVVDNTPKKFTNYSIRAILGHS